MKLLIFILLLFSTTAWGQLLPTPAVLAENGMKSVEIWKHSVPPLVEGKVTLDMRREISELKRKKPEKVQLSTWFFNAQGYPDSCWVFDRYLNKKKTLIYQFDDQKRVVFLQVNVDDKMETKEKVVRQENGNINLLYWNTKLNDWSIDYTLRNDSLFIRSRNISDSTGYYFDDRSSGVIGRAMVKDGKVAHRYAEKWITTADGKPDSVIITFEQFEDTTEVSWRSGSFVRGFKLREDGSVIPAHGMNYYRLNFFKRGHIKTPFDDKYPYSDVLRNYLRSPELIRKSEIFTERRFSNVHPQYYYEYIYTTY